MLIVNIANVMVGFSIQSGDITEFEDTVTSWFTDERDGFLGWFQDFGAKVRNHDNWLLAKIGDIAQGFTSAVNVVLIGFQIIGLILWGWVTPTVTYAGMVASGENIPFLTILGSIALMFVHWFNIMMIVKLYKFIKGSDG